MTGDYGTLLLKIAGKVEADPALDALFAELDERQLYIHPGRHVAALRAKTLEKMGDLRI